LDTPSHVLQNLLLSTLTLGEKELFPFQPEVMKGKTRERNLDLSFKHRFIKCHSLIWQKS